MLIRVKLFAAAKQRAGRDAVEVELPAGAMVADLRRMLGQAVPELSELLRNVMFAVGTDYAGDLTVLAPDADVACIPPVSGG